MVPKIPDGLTVRVTKNLRANTIRVLAYRKGRFRYPYKAVFSLCASETCKKLGQKTRNCHGWHQSDVDVHVAKLVKSYK